MKLSPILAMHGHFGGRGVFFLLMIAILAVVVIACWPNKSEGK
jgi:hypothetical protein